MVLTTVAARPRHGEDILVNNGSNRLHTSTHTRGNCETNRIIAATQMVRHQFGATLRMGLNDGSTAIPQVSVVPMMIQFPMI